jgi:hypothetical protein
MDTNFELKAETEKSAPKMPQGLSRSDIKELIGLCRREIGYTGISQDAGKRALALRAKLEAMLK